MVKSTNGKSKKRKRSSSSKKQTTQEKSNIFIEECSVDLLIEALENSLQSTEKVLFITGAGISALSGIPTYRGESNSIWETVVKDYGTRQQFLKDPLGWFNEFWLPRFYCKSVINAKPNVIHNSISELQNKFPNLYVITQNIDGLHSQSNSPAHQIIQIHGQLGYFKCSNSDCEYSKTKSFYYSLDDIKKKFCKINNETLHENKNTEKNTVKKETEENRKNKDENFATKQTTNKEKENKTNTEEKQEETEEKIEEKWIKGASKIDKKEKSDQIKKNSKTPKKEEEEISVFNPNPSNEIPSNPNDYWQFDKVPLCERCSSILLPLVLMFDEEYESHEFYEFPKALKWIEHAKMIIFIGTSHSVNITRVAEQIGYQNNVQLFNINPFDSVIGMQNISEKAEILFPKLLSLLLDLPPPCKRLKSFENWQILNEENPLEKIEKNAENNLENNLENWEGVKNHPLIERMLFHRSLLFSILLNYKKNNIYYNESKFKDSDQIILFSNFSIFNFSLGNFLENFESTSWPLLQSVDFPFKFPSIFLILDHYCIPLDKTLSVRNISNLYSQSLAKLPKQFLNFYKSHQYKLKNPNDSDKDFKSLKIKMGVSFFLGFIFDEEKFSSTPLEKFHLKKLNNAKKSEKLDLEKNIKKLIDEKIFPGIIYDNLQIKKYLHLVPISSFLFSDYQNLNEKLNFGCSYSNFEEFTQLGGIGYCFIEYTAEGSTRIVSICISAFINEDIHQPFIYTDLKRQGGFPPAFFNCL